MIITLPDGTKILLNTIMNKLRHQDYGRVCEIAKDYTAYTTGQGIDCKLKQFNMRETDQMFEQRKRLTQAITPDIANSILNPMYKVGRTPAAIVIEWKNKEATEKNKAALVEVSNNFYGNQSVDDYLSYRMVELDGTDPNSFIVVEFKEAVDPSNPETLAKPYPFEVSSYEAINYRFINNELQWLVVLDCFSGVDKKNKVVELEKYTMYLSMNSIVAVEIHRDFIAEWMLVNEFQIMPIDGNLLPGVNYVFSTEEKDEKKRRHFIVTTFEHKVGYVPAKRVGSRRDLTTRGRTCVPMMHPAQPYFEKSIKVMSEFDLTNCLHTFAQKIQYTDACPGYQSEEEYVPCQMGRTPTGHICKSCHGSGYKVHTSSQDMIQLRMPKDPKDIINLENILVYKHPPIELLEFQKKLGMYELRHAAQRAVYNSDVFSKDEIAVTATEKNIDLDAVYDTLQSFAKNYSSTWVLVMKTIAILRDLGTDLIIAHKFPNDFKMKPFSALLADLQLANNNNAPSHVKKAITKDITRRLYMDQPNEILKIETKDKFFPFPGKTESEINYILANDLTTEFNKIFYAHFDMVFSDIEYDQSSKNLDFYKMDEKMQRDLIKSKVEEYILAIETESFDSSANAFNANPDTPPAGDPNNPDPNNPLDPNNPTPPNPPTPPGNPNDPGNQ